MAAVSVPRPCEPGSPRVLFCPTATDAAPLPGFDGVPLDADVFLRPTATAATACATPPGADPSADLATWNERLARGEP